MGNHVSFRASDPTGKIVYLDGSVQEFDQPITVAELMLEHPQQVVVEFNSAMNQKRPIPLHADKKLEMRKIYLMLPMKRGKPLVLSNEESSHILFIVNNSALHSKYFMSSSKFLPWLAKLCNSTPIGEGEVVLQRKEGMEENREERFRFDEYLEEMNIEGRPEYLSKQLSGKGWKPSLDTIKEKKKKKIKRKLSHWFVPQKFLMV